MFNGRLIKDKFDNINISIPFGMQAGQFALPGCKAPRADIPKDQIARSKARSMGRKYFTSTKACKACGSRQRLTFKNKCAGCF